MGDRGRTERNRGAAIIALALLFGPGARAAEPPAPVPLRPLGAGSAPSRDWQAVVCALPGLSCGEGRAAPTLHRAANAGAGVYHAILPGPVLAELAFSAGRWNLRRRWDFTGHPLAANPDDDARAELYPALYPAGPGRWAVALQRVRSESYAGGGASFSRADFLLLPPEGGAMGPDATLFAGVPFDCSKMIRACFSERDHRRSPHCHEEWGGALSLRARPGRDPAWYDWALTWRVREWPGGVPRSRAQNRTAAATLRRGDDAETIARRTAGFDFCGGSQE